MTRPLLILATSRLAIGLGTALSALLCLRAGRASQREPEELRLLGVCAYDSAKVACWTLDGKPDRELSESLDRRFRSANSPTVPYRIGGKNRILLFEQQSQGYVIYSTASQPQIASNDLVNDGLGARLTYLAISAEPDRKTLSLTAVAPTATPAGTASSPLREGARIRMGAVEVVIDSPTISPNQNFSRSDPNLPPPRQRWNYPLSVTSPAGTIADLRATAIDLKGEVIEFVDANGRPIPIPASSTAETRSYGGLLFLAPGSSLRPQILGTTIHPDSVRELRWGATLNRLYEFKDVPLDPKR